MVLTDKERERLHEAIAEYLLTHGFSDLALQAKAALGASRKFADKDTSLERKWSIVLRLTRKNQELEDRVKLLESENADLRDPTKSGGGGAGAAAKVALAPAAPAIAELTGHRDTLSAVALHPHEPLGFSASEDGTVRVWSMESRQHVKTLREHTDSVAALAIEATEGRLMASASKDLTVKLYNIGSDEFECAGTMHHDNAVTDVKWDPHSPATLVSSTRAGEIVVWDAARCAVRVAIRHGEWIHSLAVAAGHVCVGDHAQTVALYSMATKQQLRTFTEHENVVDVVCFSTEAADALFIANNGTPDQKAFIRELERKLESAKLVAQVGLESGAAAAALSAANVAAYMPRFIVSGGRDKNVIMRDATSGALAMKFEGHENWVRALAFTDSGKHLVSCGDDGFLMVIDLATKRLHRRIAAHDHFVTCLALHPLGRAIALTGSADTHVKMWPCKP